PIERTIALRRGCHRKNWLPRGALRAGPHLVATVTKAIAWARSDPATRTLAIISYRAVSLALQAAYQVARERFIAPLTLKQWKDAGQPADVLDILVEKLAPILGEFPGELLFGH